MNYEHEVPNPLENKGKKRTQRGLHHDSETTPSQIHEKTIPTKRICRIPGELEQQNAEIEPLPPTPITEAARERLLSWGITEEAIETLREFISSFRYDLCEEKTERLAQERGYIGETANGEKEVVIPNFYNKGDRRDGQCGDISVQVSTLMNSSGFFEEVNQERQEELTIRMMGGLSRTHFTKEGQKHVWIQIGPKSAKSEDTVLIDGSFQEISTPEESNYTIKKENIPMRNFGSDSLVLKVGNYNYDEDTDRIDWEKITCETLGLSKDREVIFSIGFAMQTAAPDHPILPLIQVISEEGEPTFCFIDNKGAMVWTKEIPERYDREAAAILHSLVSISLIEDRNKAFLAKNSHLLPPNHNLN